MKARIVEWATDIGRLIVDAFVAGIAVGLGFGVAAWLLGVWP